MHRMIGYLLIMTGCSGLGIWYSMQFRQQHRKLQVMCRILELFMGQIRYGRSTLPECCLQLSQRVDEPYKSCFYEIYRDAFKDEGTAFGHLCEKTLTEGLKKLIVAKEHKELFILGFTKVGFEEDRMQIRNIEQIKDELEDELNNLSRENASKCRLAISLGAMSGLLLVIMFL